MAGSTCTIGGVAFLALASTAGRYCIECRVHAPKAVKLRFHPQGTDGNFIIFGGRNGGMITCTLRYINTPAAANSALLSDENAWYTTEVTIVDEGGTNHTRCNLEDMQRATKPMAMGRGGGLVFYDVIASFMVDF